MTASSLIKKLQELVDRFGDNEVWVSHTDYHLRLPITGMGFVEGEGFDLFVKGILPEKASMI